MLVEATAGVSEPAVTASRRVWRRVFLDINVGQGGCKRLRLVRYHRRVPAVNCGCWLYRLVGGLKARVGEKVGVEGHRR